LKPNTLQKLPPTQQATIKFSQIAQYLRSEFIAIVDKQTY